MKLPRVIALLAILFAMTCSAQQAVALTNVEENSAGKRQMDVLNAKLRTCPAGVDDAVKEAIRTQNLPDWLKGANVQPWMSGDALKASMNQISEEQIAEAARKMRIPVAELREKFMRNVPASLGSPPPGFMSLPTARISINNDAPQFCDANCIRDLSWSVVNGLAFWKNLCHTCSDDFMSIVTVNKRVWIDGRIANWLRRPLERRNDAFPLQGKGSSVSTRGIEWNAPENRSRLKELERGPFYEVVDATSDQDFRAICTDARRTERLPRAQAILYQTVCGGAGAAPVKGGATMTLELRRGKTSCGPADEFVACAKVDNAIELTFEGTRWQFASIAADSGPVGPAGEPVVLAASALTHEVGHWFGLRHLDTDSRGLAKPDFMQAAYQTSPCASELSLWLINNMNDKLYQDRFRDGINGLRRGAATRANK